jgi:hypothetical protein
MTKSDQSIGLLEAPRRIGDLLFGYDFFISYAHADGEHYPAVLADRLMEQGFRVFLDSRVYVAGDDLRFATQRRIRMSKYLLVVVGPKALDSTWVLIEVQRCIEAGRIPIAINIDRIIENTPPENPLCQLLEDKIFIADSTATAGGEPADDVIAKVMKSFRSTRQDLVRTRAVAGTVLLMASAAGFAFWQYQIAEQNAQQALEEQALRLVADAERQLFRSPQQALVLAAQGFAASPTESVQNDAAATLEHALEVVELRQALQRDHNWGSNLFQSYIAGAWFEADLAARYDKTGRLLLLTTERGKSGANPPGDALVLDTETLESTLLDIGPVWGSRAQKPGTIGSFNVLSDAEGAEIPFAFFASEDKRVDGQLVVGEGPMEVRIVAENDEHLSWSAIDVPRKRHGRKVAIAAGARVVFEVSSGNVSLAFLDREQAVRWLEQTGDGATFRSRSDIKSRNRFKRRLEYVGFSATREKIYLARQYNIEVYDTNGTFKKEIRTGGGCTKYPISLVTGLRGDKLILYGDTDGQLFWVDPDTHSCGSLGREPGRIAIKYDSNTTGTRGIIVFRDGTAAILEVAAGNPTRDSLSFLPGEMILTAGFHPTTDNLLLTAGSDGEIALWQVSDEGTELLRSYVSTTGNAIGFAEFNTDGSQIVSVDEKSQLLVWDTGSGELVGQHALTTRIKASE